MSKHNGTQTAPAPMQAAPALQGAQPPTVDQLLAEAHARLRRVNGDLVFVGNLMDTMLQELVAREKAIQELRAKLAELETPADPA